MCLFLKFGKEISFCWLRHALGEFFARVHGNGGRSEELLEDHVCMCSQ